MLSFNDRLIIIGIIFIALSTCLYSQIPDTLWTQTYGGINSDHGCEVHQTPDSGFIIIGSTYSFGSGNEDVWLIKTDSNGDTLWSKTYGCPYWDEGWSIELTYDGGYMISGCTELSGMSMDIWLLKINAQGDTIWTKKYGGNNGDDIGYDIKQTADSGFIITGMTGSYGAGYYDIWLLKTDPYGDTLWSKIFGGPGGDEGYSVDQTTDGGYIITGYTDSYGSGLEDVWLIKTDAQGDTLWTKTYGGSNNEYGADVKQTSDGGYIIVGTKSVSGQDSIWLIKTNPMGDTIWTKTYLGGSWSGGHSVKQIINGGYLVAGNTNGFIGDACLIKTDSLGNAIWTRSWGGSDMDFARSVEQTFDNGYIITGSTFSYGQGESDVWLLRIEPDTLRIDDIKNERNKYLGLDVFPNPIRNGFNIKYALNRKSLIKISLYDVSGRLKFILTNENQNPGVHCDIFKVADLPQGVYFITLNTEGYKITKKIVVLE